MTKVCAVDLCRVPEIKLEEKMAARNSGNESARKEDS